MLNLLGEGVYAAADLLCQVSRLQEVFCYTSIESMSCHRPVIGTQRGGIPEAVVDGETGFLVEPGNPEAIAEKILLISRDSELRQKMGCRTREAAEMKFDVRANLE